jgi:hypothetical protein
MEPSRILGTSPQSSSTFSASTFSSSDPARTDAPTPTSTAASQVTRTETTAWLEGDQPLGQGSPDEAVQQLVSNYQPGKPSSGSGTEAELQSNEGLKCESEANSDDTLPKAADFHLALRRFAPFYTFGGTFEGDAASRGIPIAQEGQGGHTTDTSATSRVETIVSVRADHIGSSSHCDISRHPLLGEAQGIPRTEDYSVTKDATGGHIDVSHAASNPLITSPDIDTTIRAEYAVTPAGLHLQGVVTGDDFPSSEVFVADRAGNTVMLSDYATPWEEFKGPYGHLAGEGDYVLAAFDATIPLDDRGNFAMTCEAPAGAQQVAP